MVPMNVRSAGDHLAMGNKISSLFVHLPVAASDPAERYVLQVEEAEALKAGTQHEGSSFLLDLGNHMPPVLHSFVARSLFATRLFNVTVTNVPGPQAPLYYFGSQIEEIWPLGADRCRHTPSAWPCSATTGPSISASTSTAIPAATWTFSWTESRAPSRSCSELAATARA